MKGGKTKLLWNDPAYRERMSKAHLGQSAWNKGKKTGLVPRSAFKKGENVGPDHPRWKGEEVGYRDLHSWVVKWKGNPEICEKCGRDGLSGHAVHCSNVDHKYRRVLDDYIRLCVKCHWEYDREHNER